MKNFDYNLLESHLESIKNHVPNELSINGFAHMMLDIKNRGQKMINGGLKQQYMNYTDSSGE